MADVPILVDRIPALYDLEPFGRVSAARRHAIDIAVPDRYTKALSAPQRRTAALEQSFPGPNCRSKVDRLITLSTSAVAVCCSRAPLVRG